jgi:effector-binding domain-containing protein
MDRVNLGAVTVREEAARTVVYRSMQGPYARIPGALQALYRYLEAHSLTPAGPPVSAFFTDPHEVPAAEARWEVRWPVAERRPDEAPGADGTGIRTLAARDLAVTIHTGPYDAVGEAYAHAATWIEEHGYTVVGPPEEAYLSEPEVSPEAIRTEIRFPVAHAPVRRDPVGRGPGARAR